MNARIISIICMLFLGIVYAHGQTTVNFTYDDSGNRITRITAQSLMKINKFPVLNTKDLVPEEMQAAEGELSTVVYPNPSQGLINIDILNLPLNSQTEAIVYDLNGNQLMVKKNIENSSEFNITKLKDGIYIIRIKIDDKIIDWKVVKGSQ